MINKNFFDYNTSLKDLNLFLSLGYVDSEHGQKIDKFARAVLQNNKLSVLASFGTGVTVNTFKPFNDNNDPLFISSSSASDVGEVTIFYVNSERDLKEGVVTLQGTTLINITALFGEDIHCVIRMKNYNGTDIIGTVSIADALNNVYCDIPITSGINANSSLTSIFSIPKGYVGLLVDVALIADKGTDVKGAMFTRKLGGSFIYEKALASYQNEVTYKDIFLIADENTDIMPIGIAGTGGIVYLDYQILLLKKEYIGKNFRS